MKVLKIILLFTLLVTSVMLVHGQENSTVPERTAEQEAAIQTEKIQQELHLNEEQTKQVHEINLKYARERQLSNSRSEALQRVKNKEADLRKILRPEQFERLKNKQFDRSAYQSTYINRTNSPQSPNLRQETNANPTYRTGVPVRARTINPQVKREYIQPKTQSQPTNSPDTRKSSIERSQEQSRKPQIQPRNETPTRSTTPTSTPTRTNPTPRNESTPANSGNSSGSGGSTRTESTTGTSRR